MFMQMLLCAFVLFYIAVNVCLYPSPLFLFVLYSFPFLSLVFAVVVATCVILCISVGIYFLSMYPCGYVAMYVCLHVYLIYDDLAIAMFCLLFCRLCIYFVSQECTRIPLGSV